jgi:hypothetical protein
VEGRWDWWLSELVARDVSSWSRGDATAQVGVLGEGERVSRRVRVRAARQRGWRWMRTGRLASHPMARLGCALTSTHRAVPVVDG